MKRLRKDLLSVSKTMATLTRKIEIITKKLEIIEAETKKKKSAEKKKIKSSKKAAPKPAEKSGASKASEPATIIDTVFGVIARSKGGVSLDTIQKETLFERKKIHSALYKLKKRGRIKNKEKGVYGIGKK